MKSLQFEFELRRYQAIRFDFVEKNLEIAIREKTGEIHYVRLVPDQISSLKHFLKVQ